MSQSAEWDATVHSFAEHDVYYLSGYVKAFHIHGDGDPYLLYYEADGLRAIYVYMRRKTDLDVSARRSTSMRNRSKAISSAMRVTSRRLIVSASKS